MSSMRSIHDALNATAVARTPDPALLPRRHPPASSGSRLLPPPRPVAADLATTMTTRRSSYSFGAEQPSIVDLSTLLHLGLGAAPRAGGLRSLVPHVVARGTGELAPGSHRVDLRLPLPSIVPLRAGDPTSYVAAALDQPPFATRVPLWLVLALDLEAGAARYPARHYRTLHLDAGVALQGLLLAATAMGLSACPVMGYDDRAWATLLDLPAHLVTGVLIALGGPAAGTVAQSRE